MRSLLRAGYHAVGHSITGPRYGLHRPHRTYHGVDHDQPVTLLVGAGRSQEFEAARF